MQIKLFSADKKNGQIQELNHPPGHKTKITHKYIATIKSFPRQKEPSANIYVTNLLCFAHFKEQYDTHKNETFMTVYMEFYGHSSTSKLGQGRVDDYLNFNKS